MAKKSRPTGAATARAKRKDPPPADGASFNANANANRSGRKRRKAGGREQNTGMFYYWEGNGKFKDESLLCNLVIEKQQQSLQNQNNRDTAPFEYRSGTDIYWSTVNSNSGNSSNIDIKANQTNLLVGGLNPLELQMWSSYVGADYASKGLPPSNIARKLGIITRSIWLPSDTTKKENQIPRNCPHHPLHQAMTKTMKWNNPHTRTKTPPSLAKVKKELRNSEHGLFEPCDTEEDREERLLSRARRIVTAWKQSTKHTGGIVPNWNRHGEIPIVPVVKTDENDSGSTSSNIHSNGRSKQHGRLLHTASVVTIRNMLESKLWLDDTQFAPFEKELYHLKIPIDTLSVLKALEALAKPDPALYGLPLVLGIPTLEPIAVADDDARSGRPRFETEPTTTKMMIPYKLTLSIYAHRLLFECMTADALRTVMSALDDDDTSCMVPRPLVKSPAAGPIVFGKDPKTKVEIVSDTDSIVVIDEDENEEDDDGDDDDSSDEYAEGQTRIDDTLDAFSTEGFLKLIENQGVSGVDTIYKKKIEPVLYGCDTQINNGNPLLRASLLPHQIHGVCWMYQMENLEEGQNNDDSNCSCSTNPSLGLNGLLWERRKFREGDTYYYSPALGQARLTIGEGAIAGAKRQGRRGGILADEMGLGKTVQALALVLATLDDLRKEKANREEVEKSNRGDGDGDDDDNNPYNTYSHATLIIVPPALVGQWMNEIRKITGDSLVVQFLDHKSQDHRVELHTCADIVLTTYQILESKGKKTSRKHTQARHVSNILSSTIWGRIILDEMQEVRSWNTTISKTCQELQSDRRWMLSGTPLWEGIKDFKGELCFLGLEPFAANNEDGFFDFAIANHWKARSKHGLEILRILGLVMLRRTKSMSILESNLPLLGLKNLTLVFEPVPQDPAERAMYCFLESVMHSTLVDKSNKERAHEKQSADMNSKTKQNRLIFLRLLRELCVSPYLINGGLGCSSQLTVLNRLMKEYNRKQLIENPSSQKAPGYRKGDRFYSCDEAIRFLSQVEDVARTDSDFVTDTRLGGGGGISQRNRALLINPQERVDSAREQIVKSTEIRRDALSARAKARWQWALEGVTTGRLQDKSCYEAASASLVQLWNWRHQITSVETTTVLSFLNRGFRPTEKYFGFSGSNAMARTENSRGKNKQQHEREEKLFLIGKRRPEFRWAHSFAFLFSQIPTQISCKQLQESIECILKTASETSSSATPSSQILRLRKSADFKTWEAIVQFLDGEDFGCFEKHTKKVDGVPVKIQEKLPCMEQEIAAAAASCHEAKAMFKVYPSELNERNLVKARVALKKSKLGLRILDKAHHRSGQVLCSRAFGNFRGTSPKTSETLFTTTSKQIEEAMARLAENEIIINQQERIIKSMQQKMKLNVAGTGVENLNTIDVLQALKNGEAEKTNCPICFDNLGEGEESNGKVSLTRCGHMSCKCCLKKWVDQKEAESVTVSCIECRKPIRLDQLIYVDPKKVDKEHFDNRKKEANVLVQQAAKMLEENYGQLEPHLWEALYLVIDLPPGIDRNPHGILTAIPGLFLGHMRHAMANCLPIESGPNRNSVAPDGNIPLPSKFRALLADLPRDELSVVFASSKSIVLHLQRALEKEGFGCKTLFVGQSEKESESAVSDWESPSSDDGDKSAATVLIVQAGAAACGLTLTAASKMFIIEPFRKHEEEKQAYARLHRFGQKKAVSCKVYYTPVSVESRLLEWRRRAKTHAPEEEQTVYAPLRHSRGSNDDDGDGVPGNMMEEGNNCDTDPSENEDDKEEKSNDGDGSEAVAEDNQTQFLLGLSSSVVESETADESVFQQDNRSEASGSSDNPILLSP